MDGDVTELDGGDVTDFENPQQNNFYQDDDEED
jgi:hypothetical protein